MNNRLCGWFSHQAGRHTWGVLAAPVGLLLIIFWYVDFAYADKQVRDVQDAYSGTLEVANTPVYDPAVVLLEDVGGDLVELASAFDSFLDFFTILMEGDTYYMWLNSNERSVPRQGIEQRFESADGLIWSNRTDTNLVIDDPDPYKFLRGIREIVKSNGIYEGWEAYYYEHSQGWANAMRYITSSDGVNWQVINQPALIGVNSHNVMKIGDIYHMWARVDVDHVMYPDFPQLLRYRISSNGGQGWGDWETGGSPITLDGEVVDGGRFRVRQLPDDSFQLIYFHPDDGVILTATGANGIHFTTENANLANLDDIIPGWQIVQDFAVVDVAGEGWIYLTYLGADEKYHIAVSRPSEQSGVIDDTDYGIQYGGTSGFGGWTGVEDELALGGGYRTSSSFGRTITFRTLLPASEVTLVTYRGPDQGKAFVLVDGEFQDLLNLYSPVPLYQEAQVYGGLNPLQEHTISVVVSGLKSPYSSGRDVRVDGFQANNQTIDDNDPYVSYNAWQGAQLPGAYGGSFRHTLKPNSTVVFGINGSQFTWITMRCSGCGEAEVSVDGVVVGIIDTYHPATQFQYEAVVDGLSEGDHTVQIRTLGTHNPASSGNLIVFDGYSMP